MPVLKIKFEIKLKEQIKCLHKTGKILLKIKTMVWRKKAKMGNVKRIGTLSKGRYICDKGISDQTAFLTMNIKG